MSKLPTVHPLKTARRPLVEYISRVFKVRSTPDFQTTWTTLNATLVYN